MSKNPFYNAIVAAGYITLVVSFINWISHVPHPVEDSIVTPMAMLSLLVLSAAIMAYLFFYEPVLLIIERKYTEASRLILSTIGVFAILTLMLLVIVMFVTG